jgi:hypothetical protein
MVFTKLVGIRVGIIIARDHKFAKLKRVKYLIHFYDLTSLFFNFYDLLFITVGTSDLPKDGDSFSIKISSKI